MAITWNTKENAYRLQGLYRENPAYGNLVNVCTGRKDWNSCDYIDYGLQEYCEIGALCWKQGKKHDCCRCIEMVKEPKK